MPPFNGNVEPRLLKMVDQICSRAAMWTGSQDFDKGCIFLDGYVEGMYFDDDEKHHLLHHDFQRFLVLKYGYPAARVEHEKNKREAAEARARGEEPEFEPEEEPIHPLYSNVIWWAIIRSHFKGKDHKDLFAILKEDFEQFANPLTRLVVEVQ